MSEADNRNPSQQALIAYVADLKEDEVLSLVGARIAAGDDPLAIIEDCQQGLRQVGLRYEQQQYFLSGLIMAGEIFREVMELVQPIIEAKFTAVNQGRSCWGR